MTITIGNWPGVYGATHDGDVYCVDCAIEHTPATEEWLKVGDPYDLPLTAPLLRLQDELSEDLRYCCVCLEDLPY